MYGNGELRTCKEFCNQHTSNMHCADIKTVIVVLCLSLLQGQEVKGNDVVAVNNKQSISNCLLVNFWRFLGQTTKFSAD